MQLAVPYGKSQAEVTKEFIIDKTCSFENVSMLRQKSPYFDRHSGLDLARPVLDTGESSICRLDSRWSLPRT